MTEKILNIAHRGARAYAPENTLPAFAKAREFGCDMVELDVRMTKDNVIVVFHDENLLRCTDAQAKYPGREHYNLADFNYADLAILDAGSWYAGQLDLPAKERQNFLQSLSDQGIRDYISLSDRELYASGAVTIPTLDEALQLADELGLMVNIELKSPVADVDCFVRAAISSIKVFGMTERILISSFDHSMLKVLRKYSKTLAIAALTDDPMKAPITSLRRLKAQAYNINCFKGFYEYGYDSTTGRRYLNHLNRIRKAGFGVNVWTCNNTEEMLGFLPAGVTGIISDYPDRTLTAIEAFCKV